MVKFRYYTFKYISISHTLVVQSEKDTNENQLDDMTYVKIWWYGRYNMKSYYMITVIIKWSQTYTVFNTLSQMGCYVI